MFILLFTPQIIRRKYKIKIPPEFEIILFLFIILTFFIGKIKGIVSPIFFGISIGLIAFLILLILYSSNQIKKNYFLIILFSFNFAVAFGFAIELMKFYLKLILNQELETGIYFFTMVNMSYVTIGAAISSLIGYLYMKEKINIITKIVDKFKKINPEIFSKTDSPEEIMKIIEKGENEKTEFKSTLRVNIHTNDIDKKIEYSILKTISSFLNTKGGTLLIGVSDDGKITGIEKDRFENSDKFSLHLTNLIREKIGKQYLDLIENQLISFEEKTILKLECLQSNKSIFLKNPSGEEEFYIRAGPSSTQIRGRELIEYIEKRFRKEN